MEPVTTGHYHYSDKNGNYVKILDTGLEASFILIGFTSRCCLRVLQTIFNASEKAILHSEIKSLISYLCSHATIIFSFQPLPYRTLFKSGRMFVGAPLHHGGSPHVCGLMCGACNVRGWMTRHSPIPLTVGSGDVAGMGGGQEGVLTS